MLVLTRKINEKIIIGDAICVTVTRIDGDRVRLGIEAPPDVRVFRQELISGAGEKQEREEGANADD